MRIAMSALTALVMLGLDAPVSYAARMKTDAGLTYQQEPDLEEGPEEDDLEGSDEAAGMEDVDAEEEVPAAAPAGTHGNNPKCCICTDGHAYCAPAGRCSCRNHGGIPTKGAVKHMPAVGYCMNAKKGEAMPRGAAHSCSKEYAASSLAEVKSEAADDVDYDEDEDADEAAADYDEEDDADEEEGSSVDPEEDEDEGASEDEVTEDETPPAAPAASGKKFSGQPQCCKCTDGHFYCAPAGRCSCSRHGGTPSKGAVKHFAAVGHCLEAKRGEKMPRGAAHSCRKEYDQ